MNLLPFFFVITIVLIVIVVLYNHLIKYFVERSINVRKGIPRWTAELNSNDSLTKIKHERFQFTTTDNLLIDSLFIPSIEGNKGNILFLHGIRTNKYYFLEQAIFLSKKGYNCILPDLRGHGESEGIYCTYGYLEKIDISLLIDNLSSRYKLPSSLGLWGHSMGASIALQTLELDKRIHFAILEAPFSNLKIIFAEYFRRKLWYFSFLFFKQVIRLIEKKLGFSIDEVNPAKSAKNIQQPSILLHGLDDKKILPYHSNIIFDNLPSNNKLFYEIKNANHNNIKEIWKNEYYDVSLRFISNYINQFHYTN